MTGIPKIWLGVIIVFLIQIIFKSFDLSFPNGPFEFNLRSLIFTLFFIVYGITVWWIADKFNLALKKWIGETKHQLQKFIVLILFHAAFGYSIAFIFNHIYH